MCTENYGIYFRKCQWIMTNYCHEICWWQYTQVKSGSLPCFPHFLNFTWPTRMAPPQSAQGLIFLKASIYVLSHTESRIIDNFERFFFIYINISYRKYISYQTHYFKWSKEVLQFKCLCVFFPLFKWHTGITYIYSTVLVNILVFHASLRSTRTSWKFIITLLHCWFLFIRLWFTLHCKCTKSKNHH